MNRVLFVLFAATLGLGASPSVLAQQPGDVQVLFDGSSLQGWKHAGNWQIQEDAVARIKPGGSLVYTEKKIPDDFELRFQWKVAQGSNSGVYYRPGQYEYQILDNQRHSNGTNPRTTAASLYFCMAPSEDRTAAIGQWNQARIVCKGSVIQHWLNGHKVIDFDYKDPQWADEVDLLRKRGGDLAARGAFLSLQDHGDPVWFRQITLREIPPNEAIEHQVVQPAKIPPAARAEELKKVQGIMKRRQEAQRKAQQEKNDQSNLQPSTSGSKQTFVSAKRKSPNVLFILADDQSPFDLKVYDPQSTLETPNLDRLAARGVVVDGAYHMGANVGAVCTPSRHMIMSGRSVWHLPKRKTRKNSAADATPDLAPADLAQFTMPMVFKNAGYDTMRTCKKGNSYAAANQLFEIVHEATKRGGTDETGSAWHAERVLEYLDQRQGTKDEDPFLIYFGFSHPHDTRDGKPELNAKYGAVNHTDRNQLPPANDKQPPLPANYLDQHPFHHGHPNLRDEVAVKGVWEKRDERTIRNEIGRQFACGENIDVQIGRVLEKLEAMGELDNTYIFYTADHGMAIGRHGLQGKQNLYEHTWRVPLIVSGPGIPQGKRAIGNVYLMDVLATMCDLTGVAAPKTNEGQSFKPVLMGQQETVRQTLYGVYCGGTKPGMRCVRKGDWKLIKYDVMDGQVRQTQLFNLADNPNEFIEQHHRESMISLTGVKPAANQVNLAEDPRYQKQRQEMEALLLKQMKQLDDPYRLWDQRP